jgi:hypothetical protein
MNIIVDNLQPTTAKVKGFETLYYTFWVRFMVTGSPDWVTVGGWRYWPDKRTVSTPSMNKGGLKGYYNTTKIPPTTYSRILDEVERHLGVPHAGVCRPQDEAEAA